MNIFTKFHKDWMTIVDFLSLAKFLASPIFTYSPSTYNCAASCTHFTAHKITSEVAQMSFLIEIAKSITSSSLWCKSIKSLPWFMFMYFLLRRWKKNLSHFLAIWSSSFHYLQIWKQKSIVIVFIMLQRSSFVQLQLQIIVSDSFLVIVIIKINCIKICSVLQKVFGGH